MDPNIADGHGVCPIRDGINVTSHWTAGVFACAVVPRDASKRFGLEKRRLHGHLHLVARRGVVAMIRRRAIAP